MNKIEFREILDELDWVESDVCSVLGLDRIMVDGWVSGEEIPQYAITYLELRIGVERLIARLR